MKKILLLPIIMFGLFFLDCKSQNTHKIDSLEKVLQLSVADTEIVKTLNTLAFEYLYSEPDKSKKYAEQAYLKSNSISYKSGIGASFNSYGNVYFNQGNYDSALQYYTEAYKIFDSIGEKKNSAMCLNNIGTYYYSKGDYKKTIDYYNKSLKIREEIKDKRGASDCLNNIGVVYMDQGNYFKALEYYYKTLPIKNEIGDKRGIASVLSNIASTYSYKSDLTPETRNNDLEQSIKYFNKSLQIYTELRNIRGIAGCQINMAGKYFLLKKFEESMKLANEAKVNYEKINDKRGISYCYIDIADIYFEKDDFLKAIEYLNMSLKTRNEIGEKMGQGECFFKIGKVYLELKKYNTALDYFNKYLQLAREMESMKDLRQSYEHLSITYAKLDNYKKAYEYHLLFKQMQDSIFNADNTKKITQLETSFQFEQKEREQKLIQQQKDAVKAIELKRQKLLKNAFIAGFILLLVFSFFIFRSYRISKNKSIKLAKQKAEITTQRDEIGNQRNEIEKQHHLIEIKNKNITDSIRYAQRIQNAILPLKEKLDSLLKDYFVFYRPKDIVSGDFYWIEQYTNSNNEPITLFAAVDCTGHGVPGAFMSLLGYNGLSQAVKENKLCKPSDILNFLSHYIREMLRQRKDESNVKDGMDLFLCSLNRQTLIMEYAGVHNSAYVVRQGEIITLKPDVHAIGDEFTDWFKGYTNNQFELQTNDCIYLFTDGYLDQFGGPNGKKFMGKRFKELLLEIQPLSMTEQKNRINKVFAQWKGDTVQIDDNLIIGVRV